MRLRVVLPVEMLENTIDLCGGDTRADYRTLIALTLAGRASLCRARRNLYRHVVLDNLVHLNIFLNIIGERRDLGQLVQELTLYPAGCRYVPLGTLCPLMPNARVLTLDVEPRGNPAKYFFAPTQFRHLDLKGLSFAPLRRLVQASQSLQSLSVTSMPLERGYAARVSRRAEQGWLPDTLKHMYIQVSDSRADVGRTFNKLQMFTGPVSAVMGELGLSIPKGELAQGVQYESSTRTGRLLDLRSKFEG